MVYFQLAVYFLVIIWIQDSVAQSELFSISVYPDTVSPGEEYAITCQTVYGTFWFKRNNEWTIMVSRGKCVIPQDKAKEYKCEPHMENSDHVFKLKVRLGENSPQTVPWQCVHTDGRTTSEVRNITVRNSDQSTRTTHPKTSSTNDHRTTRPTRSPHQTPSSEPSSSSKDPQTANKPPSSSASPGKPPVSSTNNVNKQSNGFTIILIAICCAVVVLVLVISVVAVLCYKKRKQDQAKQGPSRPVAQEPAGIAAEGHYDDIVSSSPPTYDWTVTDEDFGGTDDTAQSDEVPESSNPNFDASRVYGVVIKKDRVADSKNSYVEDEAEPSNPNFDPDKVYGVVDKSAKCQ